MQKATSAFIGPNSYNVVSLEVPGRLECREVVMRTVSAACKLIERMVNEQRAQHLSLRTEVVSAVGEAYNNIVLHGYAGREPGPVQMDIENCPDYVRVVIKDTGTSFDPSQALPPDLSTLPESGLGIFVMQSMVDEVSYVAGFPNVLTLVRRLDGTSGERYQ